MQGVMRVADEPAKNSGGKPVGIRCPCCGGRRWHVRNSIPKDGFITRYKTCQTPSCGRVIRTTERAGIATDSTD